MYIPKRGDFIWIDFLDESLMGETPKTAPVRFDPQAGHERIGGRPALVISHNDFNEKMGFAYVCPIGNTSRKNLFYVTIPEGEAMTGVIMTEHMRSLDFRAKSATFKGVCSELLLQDCLRRIKPIIF